MYVAAEKTFEARVAQLESTLASVIERNTEGSGSDAVLRSKVDAGIRQLNPANGPDTIYRDTGAFFERRRDSDEHGRPL